MAPTSGHILGSKQILNKCMKTQILSVVLVRMLMLNTTECSHLTLKLSRPDLSDTSSNSNDGQADANISTDDCGGGDNMTMISVRYHYTPHLVVNNLKTDKCLFLRTYFSIILCATLYEEITTETNRQVSEKISEAVPLTNT